MKTSGSPVSASRVTIYIPSNESSSRDISRICFKLAMLNLLLWSLLLIALYSGDPGDTSQ